MPAILTQTFTGVLNEPDSKNHIVHQFSVPEGGQRLRIDFRHEPERSAGADYANQLSMSLYDPNGFRGTKHNNPDQRVDLGPDHACPGYLAGVIGTGEWTVAIDTHRVLGPDEVSYIIDVTVDDEAADDLSSWAEAQPEPAGTAPRGSGWYRGDLHAHTFHSDGVWDVPEFVAYAREAELDFVALTDHNTTSALPQLHSLAGDDLLTIGGIELTTYWGHALAIDTDRWFDWRTRAEVSVVDVAREVKENGSLFVIAHPRAPGDPACTGCRWEFDELVPDDASAVEVWNGTWSEHNEDALALYYSWLNDRHRLAITAGSDNHGRGGSVAGRVGYNVVWAEELSRPAIVEALGAGRGYLSAGPRLQVAASGTTTDGTATQAGFGRELAGQPGSAIIIEADWAETGQQDRIRLIADGSLLGDMPASEATSTTWSLQAGECRWVNVEIRDESGAMRAVGNPIHLEVQE